MPDFPGCEKEVQEVSVDNASRPTTPPSSVFFNYSPFEAAKQVDGSIVRADEQHGDHYGPAERGPGGPGDHYGPAAAAERDSK